MCIFCARNNLQLLQSNDGAFVIFDKHPVTTGHSLIIPYRHAVTLNDLTENELLDCHKLVNSQQDILKRRDSTIDGFNVGVNIGATAGQTVFHCHFHLIPRRAGDCVSPEGGVRNLL